jgi:hypothetical protein
MCNTGFYEKIMYMCIVKLNKTLFFIIFFEEREKKKKKGNSNILIFF